MVKRGLMQRDGSKLALRLLVVVFMTFAVTDGLAQLPSADPEMKIGLIVTDKDRKFVGDLRKEELIVTVGGRQVDAFTLELENRAAALVLAVDNSGSLRTIFDEILAGTKAFFVTPAQQNLVLLMRFISRDKIRIADKFSSDPKYLESKLPLFYIEGGQTALIDAVFRGGQIVTQQKGFANDVRRTVVVISDGEDRESTNTLASLRDLIAKEDVQIFFIGLTDQLAKESGPQGKSPRDKAKELIETITKESGGVAIYPKAKEVAAAAIDVRSLLNIQYVVTFKGHNSGSIAENVEMRLAPNTKRKQTNLHYRPTVRPRS